MTGSITPLPSDDTRWSADLRHYRHLDGRPLEIFAYAATNEGVLRDLRTATATCLSSSLPARFREVIVLRVCAELECGSEWDVHVEMFAQEAGLAAEDLALLQARAHPNAFQPVDRLAVQLVDTLMDKGRLDAADWRALEVGLSAAQVLEAVVVAGQYLKVAWMANSLGFGNTRGVTP